MSRKKKTTQGAPVPDRAALTQTIIPVYMPSEENGAVDLVMADAFIHGKRLVIDFNDKLPSVAIRRMLERGELLGLTFVMLRMPAEEELTQEQKDARDLALLETTEEPVEDKPDDVLG